jgi:hypothetical protein
MGKATKSLTAETRIGWAPNAGYLLKELLRKGIADGYECRAGQVGE